MNVKMIKGLTQKKANRTQRCDSPRNQAIMKKINNSM